MLAQDIHTREAAAQLAHKLQQQIEMPLTLQGVPRITNLSASMGICIFPYPDCSAVDVVRRADHAMYQSKRDGTSSVTFAV